MKITVIGLGYIGLPTAAIFAKTGMEVRGYDVNDKVLKALNQGKIIIKSLDWKNWLKKWLLIID